jgi:glyoxylase-like metal-dependent hydrolase (beta-lactamase superfamily II)
MLDNPLPKLHASPPADLSFSKVSQVRAFVLERDAGNLLIYAATTMPADAVGDVSAQYINHWHELAVGGADSVHAPLVINEADRAAAEDTRPVDRTFSERATLDGDFELIPIPGHTPGATAFLWDSGEHRFLFTGDSLYLRDGRWIVAVLEDSDREAYINSLGLIAELDFDVLVPWAASRDGPYYSLTSPAETRERIDAIIERLRRGEMQ